MRVFDHFPPKDECLICNTNEDKKCVLIAIDGTGEGFTYEARAFHLDCINLMYYQGKRIIAQKF